MAMSAVSQRLTRLSPPMLWMSMNTVVPEGNTLGAERGMRLSTKPSSSEVSRMLGTFKMRSDAARLARSKTVLNQSRTSFGRSGQGNGGKIIAPIERQT